MNTLFLTDEEYVEVVRVIELGEDYENLSRCRLWKKYIPLQENKSWASSTNGQAYANKNIMPQNPYRKTAEPCKHLIFQYKPDGSELSASEIETLKKKGCIKQKSPQMEKGSPHKTQRQG